jgi:hypothetical protein
MFDYTILQSHASYILPNIAQYHVHGGYNFIITVTFSKLFIILFTVFLLLYLHIFIIIFIIISDVHACICSYNVTIYNNIYLMFTITNNSVIQCPTCHQVLHYSNINKYRGETFFYHFNCIHVKCETTTFFKCQICTASKFSGLSKCR